MIRAENKFMPARSKATATAKLCDGDDDDETYQETAALWLRFVSEFRQKKKKVEKSSAWQELNLPTKDLSSF